MICFLFSKNIIRVSQGIDIFGNISVLAPRETSFLELFLVYIEID